MQILIIEDSADGAELLELLLTVSGFRVEVAPDGQRGIEAAQRVVPHVVIADIGLPGELDGYRVAEMLRADTRFRHTPLLALSGYGHQGARVRALAAGFDAHMLKPFDITELLSWLDAAVQSAPSSRS